MLIKEKFDDIKKFKTEIEASLDQIVKGYIDLNHPNYIRSLIALNISLEEETSLRENLLLKKKNYYLLF